MYEEAKSPPTVKLTRLTKYNSGCVHRVRSILLWSGRGLQYSLKEPRQTSLRPELVKLFEGPLDMYGVLCIDSPSHSSK